jgi:hypothetical protein
LPRFQWAYCQLKRLEKLRGHSEANIRKTLATLPETLYDTYDRIFLEISDEERHYARAILIFVEGFSRWGWSCTKFGNREAEDYHQRLWDGRLEKGLLQEYMLYDAETISADHTPPDLFDLCGCLIRESTVVSELNETSDGTEEPLTLELAHYSVIEYLMNGHLIKHQNDRLRYYYLSNASIFFEFSMRVTGFALDTQERILATGQSLEDLLGNPLPESAYRLYHAMEAMFPIRRCLDDECRMLNDAMRRRLTGQILKIFDPGRSPVTARFIPFERFIEDEWQPEEATDEDVFLEFVDMDMFSIEDDCVLTRQNITCLISLALIQNQCSSTHF